MLTQPHNQFDYESAQNGAFSANSGGYFTVVYPEATKIQDWLIKDL